MKTFILALFFSIQVQALPILKCDFGYYGATIIATQTKMIDANQIGESTVYNYPGTPQKILDNIVLTAGSDENFRFQLDVGADDQNILIVVKNKKNNDGLSLSTISNPKTPDLAKTMQGLCSVLP